MAKGGYEGVTRNFLIESKQLADGIKGYPLIVSREFVFVDKHAIKRNNYFGCYHI